MDDDRPKALPGLGKELATARTAAELLEAANQQASVQSSPAQINLMAS